MMQHSKILTQIEKLIDKLPYKWVKIEIELDNETLVLEKDKTKKNGFSTE